MRPLVGLVVLAWLVGAPASRADEPARSPPSAPPEPSLAPLERDPLDVTPDATDHVVVKPGAHDPTKHEILFVPLPLFVANSDEGIGGGALFALHHYFGGVEPMRDDLSLRIYITSNLVQRHELRWEGISVLDLPLRMWARVGMFSTVSQTFCGFGNGVTCDPSVPARIARDAGLDPSRPDPDDADAPADYDEQRRFDDFVRRYYLMRYLRPHADTVMRWRLRDKPHRAELLTGWRVGWYIPGTFTEPGPWPNSLYASVFPQGEPGISSVPQLGLTLDDRDFEPAPSRGYYAEASVRGAHPLWGSTWTWGGVNSSVHLYQQVASSPKTVWAARLLADFAMGDMPTEEIAEIGGTKDWGAFGGQWLGRGVRDRRYLGKLRVIHQSELRTDVTSFDIVGLHVDAGLAAFADVGWVGYDWNNLTGAFPGEPWRAGHPVGLVWGAGLGVRLLINRAILSRLEAAASPLEQRSPSFYTPVGNAL